MDSSSEVLPFYVFNTHGEAEDAIRALGHAGVDLRKLSLVGKGYHSEEHPVGFYTAGDRVKAWGGTGALWGGLWGLLFTPAMFFLPGIGVVALAGPLVALLVSALEGAVVVGGLSALGAALSQIGVPKDQAIRYETAVRMDKFVLTVHGDVADAEQVSRVLAGNRTWAAA